MDPEAPLSSTGSTHHTESVAHSQLAISITFRDKIPDVLAVINNNGEGHYTEEGFTIPETLAFQLAIAINNMTLNTLTHPTPGQAGTARHIFVS
jgi:hypothetical protein